MIRLLIIDDHPLMREGIRSLVWKDTQIEVVGEAASGEDGLRQATSLSPDVITLDLSIPGSLSVLKHIKEHSRMIAVVVTSLYLQEHHGWYVLQAGADACICKDTLTETLVRTIRNTYSGERV